MLAVQAFGPEFNPQFSIKEIGSTHQMTREDQWGCWPVSLANFELQQKTHRNQAPNQSMTGIPRAVATWTLLRRLRRGHWKRPQKHIGS